MKSKILILLYGLVCIYISVNRETEWKDKLYVWDQAGYHHYLTATFVYDDLQELQFIPAIEEKYNITLGVKWFSIYEQPNGHKLNKYPLGTALHELPFFLIAHIVARKSIAYPADGYSLPYQYGTIICSILYVIMGFFLLRASLKYLKFTDTVIAITLLGLAMATNLYNYTAFTQGMSHPISFFDFSLVLFLTIRLHAKYNKRDVYLLAIIIAASIITRPTNLLVIIIPLLWGVSDTSTLKDKFISNIQPQRVKTLVMASVLFVLVCSIQLLYWKLITGSWIFYSYTGEGFLWSKPVIFKGLFGFRKGWFIYSPLAFVGVSGLVVFFKKYKSYFLPISIYLALTIYIVFSWWNWWYGGGFGCRPLIGSSALLALPIGAVVQYISAQKMIYKIISALVLLYCCIAIPFQTYQLSKTIFHHDRMSFKAYKLIYFRNIGMPGIEECLLPEDEYFGEMNERLDKFK